MITMKEIDVLRATFSLERKRQLECLTADGICHRGNHRVAVAAARDAVEAALRQWWKQGCKEVEPAAETWPDTVGPLNPRPRITGPSPADKLADAVRRWDSAFQRQMPAAATCDLRVALADYDSTRNADPAASALFGSPPDPILVARHLLDALTGGALASLICTVRDDLASWTSMTSGTAAAQAARFNLRANLKALGEKIDG